MIKVKTATNTNVLDHVVSRERAVEIIAKAGFDAWDFSLFDIVNENSALNKSDYIKYVQNLRRIGEDNGIVCNQAHAPFPTLKAWDFQKKAIEITAEVGGELIVVHPDNHKNAEQNAEMYFKLLPFAKECGVKIATENMWNAFVDGHATPAACSHHLDFKAHLDAVNDNNLVACLDIGHAEMKGLDTSAVKMINALRNKIQALHIHDNGKVFDDHAIPFSLNIDFVSIAKALKEIGYSGYFTLEADNFLVGKTAEEMLSAEKQMRASLNRMIDEYVDE